MTLKERRARRSLASQEYSLSDSLMIDTKLQIDIDKNGVKSGVVRASLDISKRVFEENNYNAISIEEQARLRIQEGYFSEISQFGNRTMECFIYDRRRKYVYITKISPVLENAEEAVRLNAKGRSFVLSEEQIEKALVNSVKVRRTKIPTNRLADEAETVFSFGDIARPYGEFLWEYRIKTIQILISNFREQSFANQAWFYWLGDDSSIVGLRPLSHRNCRVRGISYSS